jgi:isopentenyldiphosphate isomerase
VNGEDHITGREMRSVVHELGLRHRGVHVLLFNPDGELLIQKRSQDRSTSPSAWDCSVSEHVRSGETYLEAAVRGLREELGLSGIALQPLIVFQMEYGPNDHEISTLYQGTVDQQVIRFDPVEIEVVEYLPLERLHASIENQEREYCFWFVQIMDWSLGRPSKMQSLKTFGNPRQLGLKG